MKLKLSEAFSNDAMLKRVFTWLTRTGAGRKFGTLPIGWYQSHQCACIDILQKLGAESPVCRQGNILWMDKDGNRRSISAIELFQQADNQVRSPK